MSSQFIPLPPKEPAPQWPTAANSTTDNSVPFVVLTIIHLLVVVNMILQLIFENNCKKLFTKTTDGCIMKLKKWDRLLDAVLPYFV